jgi:PAS domain S-box-containing protein
VGGSRSGRDGGRDLPEADLRPDGKSPTPRIEGNIDGQIALDLHGVILDLNPRMEELTGASRADLVGSRFPECFHDRERAELGLRRVLAEGRLTDFELVLGSRTGTDTVLSYNLTTTRGPGGELSGVLGTARDVTEQRRIETHLRESQTYNRGLIEASPDALVTVDASLSITDVNEQLVRLTGLSRRQLVGRSFPSLFDAPSRAEEGIQYSLEHRRTSHHETNLRRDDGRLVPVAVNAGTFYDPTKDVRGTLVVVHDITESKQVEVDLREAQTYTRNLVESNTDALMTTDVLGIITDVNRQMEALTGRSRLQIVGTPFPDYFTDAARAEDLIRRVLHDDRVTDIELTIRTSAGRGVDVSYNAATLRDASGRLRGVFAAGRDITEQKRLRRELEQRNVELEVQSRRAEEANRLKSEFLANMSHELRTPLNSIIGFSELLVSQPDNGLTDEQREQVADILSGGNHLLELINDILDLAKVESGKMDLAPERFSLRQALGGVCSVVKPMVEPKQLSLRTHVEEGLDWATLDPLRFKQVLFNLLSNAAKFTPPEGSIEVTLERVAPDRLSLRVRDTGIGIAPDNLARLFRQFEQLEAGPARRFAGSGLGLALTKKIVELQGGTIRVESEEGVGTTFAVTLPVVVAEDDG